jgi:hypothetical protein
MKLSFAAHLHKIDLKNYQHHIFLIDPGKLATKNLYVAVVKHPLDVASGEDLLKLMLGNQVFDI